MVLDRARARELGRLGGEAKAANRRAAQLGPAPYVGTICDMMTDAGMVGESWRPWRVLWTAALALRPLDPDELLIFQRHTGLDVPPSAPVRELVVVAGRRSAKSRQATLAALHGAISRNYRLEAAPGEAVVCAVVSPDRKQSRADLGYIKALCRLPRFAPYFEQINKDEITLNTGCTLEVKSASHRTTRGFSCPVLVLDEVAFLPTDLDASSSDQALVEALAPTQATFAQPLRMMISTPHRRAGVLWQEYSEHFGKPNPRTLVWCADSLSMNPLLDPAVVAEAHEKDAPWALAEYGDPETHRVEFRADLESFLAPEVVAGCTVSGRYELPPLSTVRYSAFVDAASGSGGDSFAVAVGHGDRRDGRWVRVVDAIREYKPRFAPETVTGDVVTLLKTYGVRHVEGDKYAGAWCSDAFERRGVRYVASPRTKSECYLAALPVLNQGDVELLDLPALRRQLLALERRTAWGGRQSVDHPPTSSAHDDVANVAAGLVAMLERGVISLTGGVSIERAGSGSVAPECRSIFDDVGRAPRPPWAGSGGGLP